VQVINDACDRAANTFRRLMLALNEYRNPGRPKIFAPIRQANRAQVQQVQNVEKAKLESEDVPNELGCATPAPSTLPLDAGGLGIASLGCGAFEALAEKHRPADGGRQGGVAAERPPARRAQRPSRRRAARDQPAVPDGSDILPN